MNFVNLYENNLNYLLPELFLICAIFVILLYGATLPFTLPITFNLTVPVPVPSVHLERLNPKKFVVETPQLSNNGHYKLLIISNIGWLSVLSLLITLSLSYTNNSSLSSIIPISVCNGTLIIDYLTEYIKQIILSLASCCILMSLYYIQEEQVNAFEYMILILIATVGMLFLISSNDLISFYLSLEMQSLSLYVLAAFKKQSAYSTEAGLKYFLLGSFTSCILLFGVSIVYGVTGSTNFEDLGKQLNCFVAEGGKINIVSEYSLLILGIIFISTAFLFKLSAAPYHQWAPDVYEGAPTSITAFFAITPKLAVLAVALRVYFATFYDLLAYWQPIIMFCAICSMIIASFSAVSQRRIKRFFAYSSIGHVGYLIIGVGCGSIEGVHGLLLYTIIYVVTAVNVWSIVLSGENQSQVAGNKYLTDFAGLATFNPMLAITFTIALLSMAGIPPLAGFFAKFLVFVSAMEGSLYLLAYIGVLTSVLGAFYYIRLIKIMYFEGALSHWTQYKEASIDREKAMLLALTGLFVIFICLKPQLLFVVTQLMALTICL